MPDGTNAGAVATPNETKEMLTAALAKISDQVKEVGERALAEAKKAGDMSAEIKPRVDELLVKQGELQARLLDVEQKAARKGSDDKLPQQSIGNQLVSSPEYKAWIDGGGMRSTQAGFVFPCKDIVTVNTTQTQSVGVAPDYRPGVVPLPVRRMVVRDLITPGRTTSNMIMYVSETGFTNNASIVSETTQKPQSAITYSVTQTAVATLAHWIKASKQILDDFAQLQSNIDFRLRYGLAFAEEVQLLKGSGVGNNLNGIYTQATNYVAPITVPAPTKIDTIRLMMLQVEIALYSATGIVLHPSDWAAIELTKDTLGRYIIGVPQGTIAPTLWGRPVVATQAMTQDTALVGAFMLGAQLFDREDANVVISTENQDDFIKNMVTIRAEERLALAVYRPQAFVKTTDLPST